MTNTNSHIPDTERIDAYISGGLLADERAELKSHLNECPTCAAAAAMARTSDDALRRMFADARPAAGFEDRLIRAVRQEPQRRLWIPIPIRKAAMAAAAVLVIGAVGYYGGNLINGDRNRYVARKIDDLLATTPQFRGELVPASSAPAPDGNNGNQNHSQNGQNVIDSGSRIELQNNPFVGSRRDNILTARRGSVADAKGNLSTPYDSADSILVPGGDDGGESKSPADRGRITNGWALDKSLPPDSGVVAHASYGPLGTSTGVPASGLPGLEVHSFKPAEFALGNVKQKEVADLRGLSKDGPSAVELKGANSFGGTAVVADGNIALGFDVAKSTDSAESSVPGRLGKEPGQTAPPATQQPQPASDGRKIIRNGVMEFEVESFDSALAQITKIVHESDGFVSTTDSEKLPNGKVKGTITLRVPPERLDVLVLSLRALGDLKSQQINAQDVSKEYNDLESELAAAKAMEDRLLDLIKNGKGSIKDLLAAEQELGVWREKIAQAEGQIRYYNNLIGMSTLSITLYERDIKTPATVEETETADMGVESQDVEKARNDALKAIEDAKGRVLQAELKRFDGGQLAAKIEANVPSESAGAVIDRLKQIGRVARLEIHREQTAPPASDPTTAFVPQKIDRLPTRLLISLYNLANVAPRRTTNVTLAAADVESAYAALLGQIKVLEGRVVTSNLDRGDASQNSGSIVFEIPPEKLEAVKAFITTEGDLLKLSSTENADTQNTTDSKHGFTIQLIPLASVQPRESVHQAIATADVPGTYHAILDAMNAAHSRVRTAQLNEQDQANVSAVIDVEVPRAGLDSVNKALATAGDTVARDVTRASDTDNTVDSKVLMQLTVVQANRLAARQATVMEIQVSDPTKAVGDSETAVIAAGGAVVDSNISRDRSGQETAKVALDVPLGKVEQILGELKSLGTVRSIDSSRDTKAPAGPLAHAHLEISFGTSDAIVASDTGLWATVRDGLATSVAGLLWSVRLVVVGLCLIGPWVLVGWVGWRFWRRRKPRQTTA